MAGKDNLIPQNRRTKAEQRKIARKGGKRSGEVRREKKLMSQIYSEFLENKFDAKIDGKKTRLSGHEMVRRVAGKVLNRADSASVSMMREIREATEGTTHNVNIEQKNIDQARAELVEKLNKLNGNS